MRITETHSLSGRYRLFRKQKRTQEIFVYHETDSRRKADFENVLDRFVDKKIEVAAYKSFDLGNIIPIQVEPFASDFIIFIRLFRVAGELVFAKLAYDGSK